MQVTPLFQCSKILNLTEELKFSDRNMTHANREIEYGVKIKNAQEAIDFLRPQALEQRTVRIKRDIYKKQKSKYFFKVSREESNSNQQCVFSIKEDFLSQGIDLGMKVAEEIDIVVSDKQLKDLVKVIRLLGFRLASSFVKVRHEFKIRGLVATVDEYPDGAYLEVEGSSEDKVKEFISTLPVELR